MSAEGLHSDNKSQESSEALQKKREAYADVVGKEDGSLIEDIIRAIKGGAVEGGKLSAEGLKVAQVDAALEESLRNSAKVGDRQLLEKVQKSYLTQELNPNGIMYEYGLRGEINGNKVAILYIEPDDAYTGTINGTKIAAADAKRIYDEYRRVAIVQDEAGRQVSEKEVQDKTKHLVDGLEG